MAHTVESFVDTLRQQGVEAGRQAAEELRREAELQAQQVVHEAEAKARRIVEEAEKQREQTLERTRTDLELAARDTLARLRDTLDQAVRGVLDKAVSAKFGDADFLKDLMREIARQYAEADAAGEPRIEINVSEPMRHKLCDWVISTFHKPGQPREVSVDLRGALESAGFEYKVSGGTIEITPESMVETLSEIVTPELRKLIASAEAGELGG